MGQVEIFELVAAYLAGILLMGTISWLISKKTMYIVIVNSLLGGIILLILSIFQIILIKSSTMFLAGLLGIAGVIISFFLAPLP